MRILHIVGSISPEAGGTTEAVRMLIQYAPTGYESEILSLDARTETFLADIPVPVHAFGTDKSWYSAKVGPWLRTNRDRFDGVMVHGLWEYGGFAALRNIAGHKPYVVFPHGMLDPYFKHAFPAKHFKKQFVWLLAAYWVLRSAHRVLFTTAVERDLAQQSFWPSKWHSMVVALGAEPPTTNPALSAFFEKCPTVEGHPFLLFLGRIDPKKGCDLLINAFAAIASTAPDLHLVMAGPDTNNWRTQLESIAQHEAFADRVHWPGMLKGASKAGAFAACEAFILPSHQENFGIAVVEALSYAKPVLISDQVNISPDVAADGCALVAPDTLAGTTNLLQRWLDTPPETRASMSHQALQTFSARYDMRNNAATILRVFESPQPAAATPTKPSTFAEAN